MSALGARLRAAREGRGASLEAASREAGVPLRYLQMLEAGHFPTVADPAYLTHFLRRYASYLGLDTEAAARDFLSETEPEAVARRTPPEVRAATGKPRLRPRSLPPGWAVYGVALLVTVSGIFALVRFQQNRETSMENVEVASRPLRLPPDEAGSAQRALAPQAESPRSSTSPASPRSSLAEPAAPKLADAPTPEPAPTSPPAAAAPAPSRLKPSSSPRSPAPETGSPPKPQGEAMARAEANASRRPSEAVAAAPTPPPTPAPEQKLPAPVDPEVAVAPAPLMPPFELRLTATSRQVWVWLSIDGGPRQAVSLARGETAVFNANNGYVLSVDDAGGIEAMLNGEALPSFGGNAQARRNLVIPSAEFRPLGSNQTAGRAKRT